MGTMASKTKKAGKLAQDGLVAFFLFWPSFSVAIATIFLAEYIPSFRKAIINEEFKKLKFRSRCYYRLKCYEHLLNKAYMRLALQFYKRYKVKRALSKPGLIEALLEQLDKILLVYIERDLEEYRNSNYSISLKHYYEKGYKRDSDGAPETFKDYLFEKYVGDDGKPGLEFILNKVTDNFINAVSEALTRIERDHDDLMTLYFPKVKGYCVLTQIDFPVDSDLHKQGRNTLILHYALRSLSIIRGTEEKAIGKVIYKPSLMLPDMVLFGNTQALKDNQLFKREKLFFTHGENKEEAEVSAK